MVRVLELEIQNVRGIRNLKLKPMGKNLVVWGPNGSGKSAVVDAIDFLLTGRISRLIGEGTGDIALGRHGPHIDCAAENAIVSANIEFPSLKYQVELSRCIADPGTVDIVCDDSDREWIEFILWVAKRGQHVLTRREILKYITSEAGTRAQRIQALLNISEIEDVRRVLVTVRNKAGEEYQAFEQSVRNAEGQVDATVGQKTYLEEAVLDFVNQNRALLGGKPLPTISLKDIKAALRHPADSPRSGDLNVALLQRDIQNLQNVALPENVDEIATNDSSLRELLATVRSDPGLLRILSRLQLAEMGITLIDESGSCPLCDTPWPPSKLLEYLKEKISIGKEVGQQLTAIKQVSSIITSHTASTIASVEKVIDAAGSTGLEQEKSQLESWLGELNILLNSLDSVVERYPDDRFNYDRVKRMLAPDGIERSLSHINELVKSRFPKATPERNAWDSLTRLEENLKALEKARNEFCRSELYLRRANILYDSFEKARDKILGRLYDDIRDRFVGLYRQLHGIDEAEFTARIGPSGAGLDFEVDFYGRGTHPPHALHSEGHQDSMGLCLYLALAERLNKDLIGLIILDDVVMSVDVEHRRQICNLLATSFPDRQFLITTHDRTWANQLKSEGVVKSPELIGFSNWSIETGPQVNYEVVLWEQIIEDLQRGDVPSAAARLRRGLESFSAELCDRLRAPVPYKLSHRWELGDFLPATMKQFRELLKQAKRSANSWDDRDCLNSLSERENIAGKMFARTHAEQWAVDSNVHYNNWTNFVKEDFEPVVEAFRDLCGLFICDKCDGMLEVALTADKPVGVRCRCGQENWNLTVKGDNI